MERRLTINQIDTLCWEKYSSLLKENFGNLAETAAYERPESLSPQYTLALPEKIADQYRDFLQGIWKENAPKDAPAFEEIMNAKKIMELAKARYEEDLVAAENEARKVSAWEKLAASNHKDVIHYVGLLKDCTEDILKCLMDDFLMDAEKYFPK